jgi:hypothetical protein
MLRILRAPRNRSALRRVPPMTPGGKGVEAPLPLGTSRTSSANPRYSLAAVPGNYRQRISPKRVRIGRELGGRHAHSAHGLHARPFVHHTVGRVRRRPRQHLTAVPEEAVRCWSVGLATHGAHAPSTRPHPRSRTTDPSGEAAWNNGRGGGEMHGNGPKESWVFKND